MQNNIQKIDEVMQMLQPENAIYSPKTIQWLQCTWQLRPQPLVLQPKQYQQMLYKLQLVKASLSTHKLKMKTPDIQSLLSRMSRFEQIEVYPRVQSQQVESIVKFYRNFYEKVKAFAKVRKYQLKVDFWNVAEQMFQQKIENNQYFLQMQKSLVVANKQLQHKFIPHKINKLAFQKLKATALEQIKLQQLYQGFHAVLCPQAKFQSKLTASGKLIKILENTQKSLMNRSLVLKKQLGIAPSKSNTLEDYFSLVENYQNNINQNFQKLVLDIPKPFNQIAQQAQKREQQKDEEIRNLKIQHQHYLEELERLRNENTELNNKIKEFQQKPDKKERKLADASVMRLKQENENFVEELMYKIRSLENPEKIFQLNLFIKELQKKFDELD